MNPVAAELNARIETENPHLLGLLSAQGQQAFFPSKGILAQAAAARGKGINATIGVALEDDGRPLSLDCITQNLPLDDRDAVLYAPSYGKPALRDRWQAMIRTKSPSLGNHPLSRPVVTCALTHALSICGRLFLNPGDRLIMPDLFWGNYKLIFGQAFGAVLDVFPTFMGEGFNVAGLRERLMAGEPGKRVVLLNFPNNPSGYTPTVAEGKAIVAVIAEAAKAGNDIAVLVDDAYFGLIYEDGVMPESIFAALSRVSPRVLAVKIDGATKEDYVWGFRVGFITYGTVEGSAALYSALEDKTAGLIRGNISNAPHLSQSMLLSAYEHANYAQEKREKFEVLRDRYTAVRAVLAAHPEYAESFTPLPFNSGYFMCVRPVSAQADAVRLTLLADFDTGVIATAGLLRVAFSSVSAAVLPQLFKNIDAACRQCG